MTLEEMKIAVKDKLKELIPDWTPFNFNGEIFWESEGLKICHEAFETLDRTQRLAYGRHLQHITGAGLVGYVPSYPDDFIVLAETANASYQQRLETLCRVWWPKKF